MRMETGSDERPHRRWTRAEYDQLIELGVLGSEDHVELIEGEILVMSPEGTIHAADIGEARIAVEAAFGRGYWVRETHPIVIEDHSEPEPDLVVVRGRPRDYRKRHPGPLDALLVVEVSKSSLSFDTGRKLRLYARAKVADYWVVDLVDGCVHVHRKPKGDRYTDVKRYEPGESIRPINAAGTVAVSDILE